MLHGLVHVLKNNSFQCFHLKFSLCIPNIYLFSNYSQCDSAFSNKKEEFNKIKSWKDIISICMLQ